MKIVTVFTLLAFTLAHQAGWAKAWPEFAKDCEVGDSKIAALREQIVACMKGTSTDVSDHCDYYKMLKKDCGMKSFPRVSEKYLAGLACGHNSPSSTIDQFYRPFAEACRDKPEMRKAIAAKVQNFDIDWDVAAWKKSNPDGSMGKPLSITSKGGVIVIRQGIFFDPQEQLRAWMENNL